MGPGQPLVPAAACCRFGLTRSHGEAALPGFPCVWTPLPLLGRRESGRTARERA